MAEVIEVIESNPQPVVVIEQPGTVAVVEIHDAPRGPAGPPGAAGSGFVHTQLEPVATWTIPHSFNRVVGLTLLDVDGHVFDSTVTITPTVVTVTNSEPISGYAILT